MECKSCGGECRDIGGGKFRCVFCGAEFTDSAAPKPEPQPAPTAAQQHSYDSSANTNRAIGGADLYEINEGGILEIYTLYGSGSGYLVTSDGYGITKFYYGTGIRE